MEGAQEPPTKRARVGEEASSVSSNQALTFVLVDPRRSATSASLVELEGFQPEFTHQTFGQDEEIKGFQSLAIKVHLSPASFHSLVQISYSARRPGADDVLQKLQEAFPAGLSQNKDSFLRNLGQFSAVKNCLSTLTVACEAGGTSVRECTLDQAQAAIQDLHARLQPMLYFFVDGASLIDSQEPGWTLLLATQQHGGQTLVVGFCTFYTFYAYPHSVRLRVSQILVLPPYQRKGIGKLLLQAVYRIADQRAALDVTFEDPTDQLQLLREGVEVQRALACPWLVHLAREAIAVLAAQHEHTHTNGTTTHANGHANGHAAVQRVVHGRTGVTGSLALGSEDAARAHAELRITPQQVRLAWEALLARQPSFEEGPGRAALKALVERRLLGKLASTKASAARKRVFNTGAAGFVMRKVSELEQMSLDMANTAAGAGTGQEADDEEAEEDLDGIVATRLQTLYSAAGVGFSAALQ